MWSNAFKMPIKLISMQSKYNLSWYKPLMVVFKLFSRKHFSAMPDWNVLYTSECVLNHLKNIWNKMEWGWNRVWHILRYRAHFSLALQKSVFLKIAWKQPLKAYINSNCIYFAYQLTELSSWMHLSIFQAKLAWLDQQKIPIFLRLPALRQSSC